MIRPPRRSPLFPNTTLFRSKRSPRIQVPSARRRPGVSPPEPEKDSGHRNCRNFHWPHLPLLFFRLISLRRADRKSTRLNSSHQIISYAVFFLKKKKKTKV